MRTHFYTNNCPTSMLGKEWVFNHESDAVHGDVIIHERLINSTAGCQPQFRTTAEEIFAFVAALKLGAIPEKKVEKASELFMLASNVSFKTTKFTVINDDVQLSATEYRDPYELSGLLVPLNCLEAFVIDIIAESTISSIETIDQNNDRLLAAIGIFNFILNKKVP